MPVGTIRVTSTGICAALRGAMFEPCFDVVQTSSTSFRGSLSGFGFAYCDFVRRNPRMGLTGADGTPALRLRPTTSGSATRAAPPASAGNPQSALAPNKTAPVSAPEPLPPASPAEVAPPVQSAVVTFE